MYADGIDDDDDRRRDDDDDDRAGALVGGLELRAPRDAAIRPSAVRAAIRRRVASPAIRVAISRDDTDARRFVR